MGSHACSAQAEAATLQPGTQWGEAGIKGSRAGQRAPLEHPPRNTTHPAARETWVHGQAWEGPHCGTLSRRVMGPGAVCEGRGDPKQKNQL